MLQLPAPRPQVRARLLNPLEPTSAATNAVDATEGKSVQSAHAAVCRAVRRVRSRAWRDDGAGVLVREIMRGTLKRALTWSVVLGRGIKSGEGLLTLHHQVIAAGPTSDPSAAVVLRKSATIPLRPSRRQAEAEVAPEDALATDLDHLRLPAALRNDAASRRIIRQIGLRRMRRSSARRRLRRVKSDRRRLR